MKLLLVLTFAVMYVMAVTTAQKYSRVSICGGFNILSIRSELFIYLYWYRFKNSEVKTGFHALGDRMK